jgi:membrane-bound inhibitor of C-type lysozyme
MQTRGDEAMNAYWITTRASRGLSRLLVAAGCAVAASASVAEDMKEPISEVKYACADDKSIEATYYADEVELMLSDGREMMLPQTISGSGIRYANADESFVFWSKGNTAFATEGDPNTPTFADCVEQTDG